MKMLNTEKGLHFNVVSLCQISGDVYLITIGMTCSLLCILEAIYEVLLSGKPIAVYNLVSTPTMMFA